MFEIFENVWVFLLLNFLIFVGYFFELFFFFFFFEHVSGFFVELFFLRGMWKKKRYFKNKFFSGVECRVRREQNIRFWEGRQYWISEKFMFIYEVGVDTRLSVCVCSFVCQQFYVTEIWRIWVEKVEKSKNEVLDMKEASKKFQIEIPPENIFSIEIKKKLKF